MKTFIIALVCFVLGAGVFWGYGKYQGLMDDNDKLRKMVKEIPSTSIEPTSTPAPGFEIEEAEPGAIEGVLGYPSEGIPPLEVYAINKADSSIFFMVKTAMNQGTFIIDKVDSGTYNLVAYPIEDNGTFSGGYTKAVPCGLSVICNDHSLIDVEVLPGETAKGVEIRDWYAPEGSFPAKPKQ